MYTRVIRVRVHYIHITFFKYYCVLSAQRVFALAICSVITVLIRSTATASGKVCHDVRLDCSHKKRKCRDGAQKALEVAQKLERTPGTPSRVANFARGTFPGDSLAICTCRAPSTRTFSATLCCCVEQRERKVPSARRKVAS